MVSHGNELSSETSKLTGSVSFDKIRMTDEYFVPTRVSRVRGTPAHQVVVHASEKREDSKPVKQTKKEKGNSFNELDMKNARFEIYKFAQSGLKNVDKQNSQKELAVKLGAVPPKRKYVNYKEYKEQQKKLKKAEKEAAELSKLGYIHRPVRAYKQSGRNPKAKLHKKMELGTGILKKYGTMVPGASSATSSSTTHIFEPGR